ncbi:MAG: M48 family metalloprotease [Planctomycetota bacterium]
MNLLVGLVILVCLVASEFQTDQPVVDLPVRLLLVGVTTILVPGLALFQSILVTRWSRSEKDGNAESERAWSERLRRLSACHTAVWLSASMAIVWSLRWPEVIRVNWDLDRFVLVDELCILAPILMSLIASWLIFFEIDRPKSTDENDSLATKRESWLNRLLGWILDRERYRFLSLRIQLQILIVLIPVLMVVALNDSNQLFAGSSIQWLVVAMVMATIGVFYPLLQRLVWRTSPLVCEPGSLRAELDDRGLGRVGIATWQTELQLVNACVVSDGWRRRILLSDRLQHEFPVQQIRAVVRHEAGHLIFGHGWLRTWFALLPLVALAMAGWIVLGSPLLLEQLAIEWALRIELVYLTFAMVYCLYFIVVFRWLSHDLEYEADYFACCQLVRDEWVWCEQLSIETSQALLRLAAYQPVQLDRGGLFHPSLRSRIESIINQHVDHALYFDHKKRKRIWVAARTLVGLILFFGSAAAIPV